MPIKYENYFQGSKQVLSCPPTFHGKQYLFCFNKKQKQLLKKVQRDESSIKYWKYSDNNITTIKALNSNLSNKI